MQIKKFIKNILESKKIVILLLLLIVFFFAYFFLFYSSKDLEEEALFAKKIIFLLLCGSQILFLICIISYLFILRNLIIGSGESEGKP